MMRVEVMGMRYPRTLVDLSEVVGETVLFPERIAKRYIAALAKVWGVRRQEVGAGLYEGPSPSRERVKVKKKPQYGRGAYVLLFRVRLL